MEKTMKFVDFNLYCNGGERKDGKKIPPCKHLDNQEWTPPCNYCLCQVVNENSEKPVSYEEEK